MKWERLNPDKAWAPYTGTWTRSLAAHLLRRAGFGVTAEELDVAETVGLSKTLDHLLNAVPDRSFTSEMATMSRAVLANNDPKRLSSWWLYKMVNTPAPLAENMTLFWHGHFATSAQKVKNAKLMKQQLDLLSREALGSFEKLVVGISRDPAMLIYLDATSNKKARANENYARELMELFSLGVDEYTEKDIKELARCFTGWEVKFGKARFFRHYHDTGEKEVLGKRGRFNDEQAVRVILEQPVCGHFIAAKLIRHFVADLANLDEIPHALTAPLAKLFIDSGFEIKPLVRRILGSQLFFAREIIGQKIRSPVELVVGTLRSLEMRTNIDQIRASLQMLGQLPLFPPSVKGWDGGRTWINASSLLGRVNVLHEAIGYKDATFGEEKLDNWFRGLGRSNEKRVDHLLECLVAVPLQDDLKSQLIRLADRPADLMKAVVSLPEFQLE